MKKIKKSVIFTSYDCNNNCVFCIDADKKNISGRSTAEIKKEISSARKRGAAYLELIGGEVTIRKDALDLVSFAHDLGFKTISLNNCSIFKTSPALTRYCFPPVLITAYIICSPALYRLDWYKAHHFRQKNERHQVFFASFTN